MTIALWSMLALLLITYVTGVISKTLQKGYNNVTPREFMSHVKGKGALAWAAHQNHLESLPFYFSAVVLATVLGMNAPSPEKMAMLAKVDSLAIAFIATRLIYTASYLAEAGTLRSLVWVAGVAINVMIFMAPF